MIASLDRRVAEVAAVFNGKTPSKLQQRDSGHPVLKIKDVDELGSFRGSFSGHVDPEMAKKHLKQQLAGGETLVLNAAHSATHVASKTFFADEEVAGSLATGEWLIVRWAESEVVPRFGNHWINSPETRFRLRLLVNGIHLYPKDVARLKIPLPPLAEQQRIARILDAADALRVKRRESLAQLDTLLQSTFLDMFGDPVTNPRGWEVLHFEECCEAIFKGAFDLKAASYQDEGIPFIRIADIQDRTIDLSNAVFIDEETHDKYKRSELTPGDIVFSKVGTIDRIAAIPHTIPRCNCSQNNVGARLKSDLLQIEFALALLTTSAVLDRIRAGSKKAVQDKLVLSELRKLSVILPPPKDQRRFATIVESVEQQKACQRAHLAELDILFASLQSRAFRGDL